MLYFLPTDPILWTCLAVGTLLGVAYGAALANLGPDAKAGRGARHRAPGLPRVTRSGTYPRRRHLDPRDIAQALGMAGRVSRTPARIPASVLVRGVLLDLGRRAGVR